MSMHCALHEYVHCIQWQLASYGMLASNTVAYYVVGKVEPGTRCSRIRKNLRKRVSKRIRE